MLFLLFFLSSPRTTSRGPFLEAPQTPWICLGSTVFYRVYKIGLMSPEENVIFPNTLWKKTALHNVLLIKKKDDCGLGKYWTNYRLVLKSNRKITCCLCFLLSLTAVNYSHWPLALWYKSNQSSHIDAAFVSVFVSWGICNLHEIFHIFPCFT